VPDSDPNRPQFIISSTGRAVHPDEVVASCTALERHLDKTASEADALIKKWEEGVRERELAEKRRVAPGWLDRDEKMLEPERKQSSTELMKDTQSKVQDDRGGRMQGPPPETDDAEGRQLDEAFGSMRVR